MSGRIREAQVAYPFSVDEKELGEHPLILERGGKPVAAVVPIDEYKSHRRGSRDTTNVRVPVTRGCTLMLRYDDRFTPLPWMERLYRLRWRTRKFD